MEGVEDIDKFSPVTSSSGQLVVAGSSNYFAFIRNPRCRRQLLGQGLPGTDADWRGQFWEPAGTVSAERATWPEHQLLPSPSSQHRGNFLEAFLPQYNETCCEPPWDSAWGCGTPPEIAASTAAATKSIDQIQGAHGPVLGVTCQLCSCSLEVEPLFSELFCTWAWGFPVTRRQSSSMRVESRVLNYGRGTLSRSTP